MKRLAVLDRLLRPGDRVIAAVLGGADSVCLVQALREVSVSVVGLAHFNHEVRDTETWVPRGEAGDPQRLSDLPISTRVW